jgi:DNA-binding transcriptional regulator GbsR (MarR family)
VNEEQQRSREWRFVEEVGLFFEQRGLPRMAGRILGWLLICDPPYQSAGELADALLASKGSISTMTRMLIRLGIIERTGLPGQRRDYFLIKPDAWNAVMKESLTRMSEFRHLLERGLEMLEGKDLQIKQRLEGMRNIYVFWEREWHAVLERWEQQERNRGISP